MGCTLSHHTHGSVENYQTNWKETKNIGETDPFSTAPWLWEDPGGLGHFHDGLLTSHLQELGKSSANAQGLRRPVTSGEPAQEDDQVAQVSMIRVS